MKNHYHQSAFKGRQVCPLCPLAGDILPAPNRTPLESALPMSEILVIGPVNGVYHLGYQVVGSNKFYSLHQFISKALADLTAWRMNSNREKGIV